MAVSRISPSSSRENRCSGSSSHAAISRTTVSSPVSICLVERNGFVGLAPAQLHQRLVDRDPHNPGVELGIALELIQVLVGFHKGLLQHIFRIFAVLRDVLRQAEDLAFVAAHQFAERGGIAFARLRHQ